MKIRTIKLQTAALPAITHFYHHVLGLEYSIPCAGEVAFQIGRSQLVFAENPAQTGIYHFAINIPCNQIHPAMMWLEDLGIALVPGPNGDHSIDFTAWHAEATYFFDPAGNIVEFIARRDLHNESKQPFGAESLLEISEIGIVTSDVLAWNARVEQDYGITPFDKSTPRPEFSALGADSGLFIVVPEGRKWFLTDIPATRERLEVRFENSQGEEGVIM